MVKLFSGTLKSSAPLIKLINKFKATGGKWLLIIILLLVLILLAIWPKYCSIQPGSSTKPTAACSYNGYTAVYYPFKGSSYQEIILESASGKGSSLDRFLQTKIKYGSQALVDIQGLTCLESLDVFNTGGASIIDISPLAQLTQLKELYIDHAQIKDLTPLSQLTKLESLMIADAYIIDISPLRNLRNLHYLNLSDNPQVSHLEPLRGMTKLETLILTGTSVQDFTPLYSLPRLTSLYLADTYWSEKILENIDVSDPNWETNTHIPAEITNLRKALPELKIEFGEAPPLISQ